MLEAQNAHMWDYLFENGDRTQGRSIWSEFFREDIIPFAPYDIIGCPDGFQFDLGGGHIVELVHMGGHTAGSCGFLDLATGSLFTGDDLLSMRVGIGAVNPGAPYAKAATVETMRSAFERLAERKAQFSHVYPGHFATDLENVTVDAMLDACSAICSDPVGNASYREESPHGLRLYRCVEGLGTICYTPESV